MVDPVVVVLPRRWLVALGADVIWMGLSGGLQKELSGPFRAMVTGVMSIALPPGSGRGLREAGRNHEFEPRLGTIWPLNG